MLAVLLQGPAMLRAQVSLYEFSQSVETYTPITEDDGGVALGAPTWNGPHYSNRCWVNNPFNDPGGNFGNGYLGAATGPGYPIGFDFTFNGDVFDVVGISQSGWIGLGKSSDGLQAVWVYDISHPHGRPFVQSIGGPSVPYKRNRIAGWGHSSVYMHDMSPLVPPGPITSLRMATIGTAPNRVCVIQFQDFLGAYPPSASRLNFQIRLHEADNAVEVRYGQMLFNTISNAEVQVGLGGRVPEDFNSRKTVYEQPSFLYDWNTTVAATLNTEGCVAAAEQTGHPNGSGLPPVPGLTFRWTPPVCPPPVWPVSISEVTFASAVAQWTPNASGEYEFFVSTENSITGPEISSGTNTDPEAVIEGLEPGTTYYVFVRSICGGEPGTWSLATEFETFRGGVVECDGGVVLEDYCSVQYEVQDWLYISADGSPLRIEFLDGLVGNTGSESFSIWLDGAPVSGTPNHQFTGDLTGQVVQSTTGQIRIRLVTDAGACTAQEWYVPIKWRIGCKDCNDPLVNYSVVTDCDNMQYSVIADIFNLGSSAIVRIDNSLGVPPIEVSTTGQHTVGPFPAGSSVVVTAQNPDNMLCYMASAVLLNEPPCALEDCGPTTYTHCYGDEEWNQWAYQGAGGLEIGIRFIQGTVGFGDNGKVYNGADPFMSGSTNLATLGGLANQLITSGPPSTDHTLVLELISDGSHSCADADPLYGTSQSWEYVVACFDGCTQPAATFTSNCINNGQYEVTVNVTGLGSTGAVTITNNGGVASVPVTEIGTYTVGPFTSGTPVRVDVEGASVLCTWSSPTYTTDCSTMSVMDITASTIGLFPNPNTGMFSMELPRGWDGSGVLRVMDLSGRVVAQERITGVDLVQVQLPGLSNGLYSLVLTSGGRTYNGKLSIQH